MHIEKLISQIKKIIVQNNEKQNTKKINGENFNIFNILGLWSEEVRLHSSFIAELLNVNGSHGLNDSFLKEFISVLQLDNLNFETINSKTIVEFNIGQIKENTGGRIDIIIKSGGKAIIIENKIYASDQDKQLIRYFNYAKQTYVNGFIILYLNLFGNDADEKSTGIKGNDIEYKPISYSKDIIKWLQNCEKIARNQPLVKETINQYIKLIKQLTNQDMDTEYIKNVINILTLDENIDATTSIFKLKYEWECSIVERYLKPSLKHVADELGLIFDSTITSITFQTGEFGFYFRKKEWEIMAIFIYREYSQYGFFKGISNYSSEIPNDFPLIKIDCLNNKPNNNVWPYGTEYLSKYKILDIDMAKDIINGKYAEHIKEIVEELLYEINSKNLRML